MEKRIAIIDLGSNSARLVIFNQSDRGLIENENLKQVLRLSSHLTPDGEISQAGISITIDCMHRFKQLCQAREVTEIIGVATAAVRQAKNGPELIQQIHDKTGISFRTLSGTEEATYGYLAVVNSTSIINAFTVDIGGGSTELTLVNNRLCKQTISFPFGAVTLTNQFFTGVEPTDAELQALHSFLLQQFSSVPWLKNGRAPLVALGGAARTVGNIDQKKRKYPFQSLHHYTMDQSDIADIYVTVTKTPLEKRKKIKGMSKDRADIIIASLVVFLTLLEVIGTREFTVSTKGLRDGILFERILQDEDLTVLDDVALFDTEQLMKRYQVQLAHSEHVSRLALSLFDQFREHHLLHGDDNDRKLLQIAALLHDIGRSVNVYETHQHTFYLLTNVLLMGLTHRERLIVALLAAYKNDKKLDKQAEPYTMLLSPQELEHIKSLAPLLLIARALDRSMTQPVKKVVLHKTVDGCSLTCHGTKRDLVEYTFLREVIEQLNKTYQCNFYYQSVPFVDET